jgi:ADP-heptose:LPS heptosyltransferase
VLAHYPEIDTVLTLPFPGFSRQANENWRSPYELAFNTARHLRRIVYSSAVILRPDHWWGAMVSHLASIPKRIGYNLPDTAPYLTTAIPHQHEHAVRQSLRLVETWTGPLDPDSAIYRFPIDDLDRSYVDSYLEEWGIAPDKPIFCIHPGSGAWTKNWADDRWAVVADTLIAQLDAPVVFTGSEQESAMVKGIVQNMKQTYCVISGETHIGQLAALYARAQVVLGPDSGPLHLAAAVGTPTVSLFGPADPAEFGPWGPAQQHIVLSTDIGCRPCRVLDWADDNPDFHPCVRDITTGQVLEAARRVVQSQEK